MNYVFLYVEGEIAFAGITESFTANNFNVKGVLLHSMGWIFFFFFFFFFYYLGSYN
jgi:hypothetical protein